jgi:hypothetical protein
VSRIQAGNHCARVHRAIETPGREQCAHPRLKSAIVALHGRCARERWLVSAAVIAANWERLGAPNRGSKRILGKQVKEIHRQQFLMLFFMVTA